MTGPEKLPRGLYYKAKLDDYVGFTKPKGKPKFVGATNNPLKLVESVLAGEAPNLIGSKIPGTLNHAPVFDFDFPCRLVPSSTPGHYHFFIDVPISENGYLSLLRTLYGIGLIQYGVMESANAYKETYVRWNTTKQQEGLM